MLGIKRPEGICKEKEEAFSADWCGSWQMGGLEDWPSAKRTGQRQFNYALCYQVAAKICVTLQGLEVLWDVQARMTSKKLTLIRGSIRQEPELSRPTQNWRQKLGLSQRKRKIDGISYIRRHFPQFWIFISNNLRFVDYCVLCWMAYI